MLHLAVDWSNDRRSRISWSVVLLFWSQSIKLACGCHFRFFMQGNYSKCVEDVRGFNTNCVMFVKDSQGRSTSICERQSKAMMLQCESIRVNGKISTCLFNPGGSRIDRPWCEAVRFVTRFSATLHRGSWFRFSYWREFYAPSHLLPFYLPLSLYTFLLYLGATEK